MSDGSILIDTKLDTTQFSKGLSALGNMASSGFAALGKAAIAGVTAVSGALSTLGAFSVKSGMSFDTAMSQVAATMGTTVDQIQLLSDKAKEMGAKTAFSATEAAQALNYLALAGYDAKTSADVLPSVLNLAAAGGMDLAYASDLATDAMSALGIAASQQNLTQFGDQMAKTASKSNTSVAQLGEAILTVGGTATMLKGKTVELNTALGVLANRGIKGAEGGTHLRNIILSLTAPTNTAAEAIKKLGVSVTDSSGNLRPLNEILADFNKKTAGMSDTAKANYLSQIFNKTDLAAVQGLLAGCGQEWSDLEKEVSNCNGAMSDMAAVQLDNLEGDITILKSGMEGLGIAIYDNLRDPLRDATQTATKMIEELSNAVSTGGLAGGVAAAGTVIAQTVAKISEAVPTIINLSVQLIQAFIQGIQQNAGTIAQAAAGIVSTLIQGVLSSLPTLATTGINLIAELISGFASSVPQLIQSGKDCIVKTVEAIVYTAPQLLQAGTKLIQSLISGLTQAFPDLATSAQKIVPKIVDGITSALPKLATAAVKIMSNLGKFIENNFSELLKVGLEAVVKLTGSIRENAGKIVDGAISLAKSLAKGLIDSIPTIVQNVPTIVSNIANVINDNAPKILKAGVELIVMLVKGLIQSIPTIIQNLPKIISAIVDTLQAFNWVNLGSAIISKLSSGISGAVNLAKNAMNSVLNALKGGASDIVNSFVNLGKNIVQGLWKGISSLTEWIGKKIAGFGATLVSGFKALLGIHSPSKVFAQMGKYCVEGLAEGLEDKDNYVSDAMRALKDDMTTTYINDDMVGRLNAAVETKTGTVSDTFTDRNPDGSTGSGSGGEPIDYKKLARAVWDEAPSMDVNMDGKKVGTIIEPVVSERQAKKTKDKQRRDGNA